MEKEKAESCAETKEEEEEIDIVIEDAQMKTSRWGGEVRKLGAEGGGN